MPSSPRLDGELQPAWKNLLAIPVATRTRAVIFVVLPFIFLIIIGINSFIDSYRPDEGSGPPAAVDASSNELSGLSLGAHEQPPPTSVVQPSEVRLRKIHKTQEALEQIGRALEAYARDRQGFPAGLTDGLGELVPYGLDSSVLTALEGEKLSAYQLDVSLDYFEETVLLKARPKHMDDLLSHTVTYARAEGTDG